MPFGIFEEERATWARCRIAIENPFFGSATLFVQLLPIEYGEQKPRDKRRAGT